MIKGVVWRVSIYTREAIRADTARLYVFGDNMAERGYGGQAKEARGLPNTVGIPTKWAPPMLEVDFFTDDHFEMVKPRIDAAFDKLEAHLQTGKDITRPYGGVGTGPAQLPTRAPKIFAYIEQRLRALETA